MTVSQVCPHRPKDVPGGFLVCQTFVLLCECSFVFVCALTPNLINLVLQTVACSQKACGQRQSKALKLTFNTPQAIRVSQSVLCACIKVIHWFYWHLFSISASMSISVSVWHGLYLCLFLSLYVHVGLSVCFCLCLSWSLSLSPSLSAHLWCVLPALSLLLSLSLSPINIAFLLPIMHASVQSSFNDDTQYTGRHTRKHSTHTTTHTNTHTHTHTHTHTYLYICT